MKKNKKIYKIALMILMVMVMTGCQAIKSVDFGKHCVQCGDDVYFPSYLVKLCSNLIQFIQLIVPVIIIIVGLIELTKAVISSDEKKMAESKNSLIRKIITGVMIYLVIAVVQFFFDAVPNLTDGDIDTMDCMSYFINGVDQSIGCPQRVVGKAKKIPDEGGDLKGGDVIEKKPRKGKYEDCKERGEDTCTDNDEVICCWQESGKHCTVCGHRITEYKCWKCTSGGETTYKWSDKGGSSCTAVTPKGDQEQQHKECDDLIKQAENNLKKCYVCEQNGKIIDYLWVTKTEATKNYSGCHLMKSQPNENGCKTLKDQLNPKKTEKGLCYECKQNGKVIDYIWGDSAAGLSGCNNYGPNTTKSECQDLKDKLQSVNNSGRKSEDVCWWCVSDEELIGHNVRFLWQANHPVIMGQLSDKWTCVVANSNTVSYTYISPDYSTEKGCDNLNTQAYWFTGNGDPKEG